MPGRHTGSSLSETKPCAVFHFARMGHIQFCEGFVLVNVSLFFDFPLARIHIVEPFQLIGFGLIHFLIEGLYVDNCAYFT